MPSHIMSHSLPASHARSEPLQLSTANNLHIAPLPLPPPPSLPPLTSPLPPTQIHPGVWLQDDDIIYAPNWPPVQHYLAQIREHRRMLDAPSDIILTLAALDVVYHPLDPAHWIFWAPESSAPVAKVVDVIAVHRPRLIKSPVPWTGMRQYKDIIGAIQEKFRYLHLKRKWYPVDGRPVDSQKRTLRSSGESPEQTVNEYFNLVTPSSKKPKTSAKKPRPSTSSPKQHRRPAPGPSANPPSPEQDSTRTSTRTRRTLTPSLRSPIDTSLLLDGSPSEDVLESSELSFIPSSASSSSSHFRSTSQSSAETVVDNERCSSVVSTDTVVAGSPSKKRKADDIETDDTKDQEGELSSTEGMVTRGRASKTRPGDIRQSPLLASRSSTPTAENPLVKSTSTRPRARAKKA